MANGVAEILENSTIDRWRHVEGKLNPADIGTRGMTVEALKELRAQRAGVAYQDRRRLA